MTSSKPLWSTKCSRCYFQPGSEVNHTEFGTQSQPAMLGILQNPAKRCLICEINVIMYVILTHSTLVYYTRLCIHMKSPQTNIPVKSSVGCRKLKTAGDKFVVLTIENTLSCNFCILRDCYYDILTSNRKYLRGYDAYYWYVFNVTMLVLWMRCTNLATKY